MRRAKGSIIKMTDGKRRNKYRVRITLGYKENGSAIYQNLGCYNDKKIAEKILSSYIINPTDVKIEKLTFKDIYEKWFNAEAGRLSKQRRYIYDLAFRKCKDLHKICFKDIRDMHMHSVLDRETYSIRHEIKVLFSKLFNFAMKNDIVMKDYSKFLNIGKAEEKKVKRRIFTEEEIEILFANIDRYDIADIVLIMIYTSFRIGEMFLLQRSININLEERYIQGGIKTESGKNRIVPIHPRILPLVIKRCEESESDFVFATSSVYLSNYGTFRRKFNNMMEELGIAPHTPHDCRHTFSTRINDAGANGTSIKTLVGHSTFEFTEKIYTQKSIAELRKAIEKMQ